MAYDFTKTFDRYGLGDVDYWRCGDCGFVISRTHAELSAEKWTELNVTLHSLYQGGDENPTDPRWKQRIAAQARALAAFAKFDLIPPSGRWLDYGCGDGGLSAELLARSGLRLPKFDQYMAAGADYLAPDEIKPGAFDFVITTSVFEHLWRRGQWDAINGLVSASGVLGLHTLVRENVPRDPDWFYLQAPHTAFFSNAAMSRLFADWGYRSSVYDVEARLWLWFREDAGLTAQKVAALNQSRAEPIPFVRGFLDYWK